MRHALHVHQRLHLRHEVSYSFFAVSAYKTTQQRQEFLVPPLFLNQSKHSNLFKTKQAITNKQKEQLQNKNNNVEPTQAF